MARSGGDLSPQHPERVGGGGGEGGEGDRTRTQKRYFTRTVV